MASIADLLFLNPTFEHYLALRLETEKANASKQKIHGLQETLAQTEGALENALNHAMETATTAHDDITSLKKIHELAMVDATEAAKTAAIKAEAHAKLNWDSCSREAFDSSQQAESLAREAKADADAKLAELVAELQIMTKEADNVQLKFAATLKEMEKTGNVNEAAAALENNKLKATVKEVREELKNQQVQFAEETSEATKAATVKATAALNAANAASEAAVTNAVTNAETEAATLAATAASALAVAEAAQEQKTQMEVIVLAQKEALAAAIAEADAAKAAEALAQDAVTTSAEATASASATAKAAAAAAADALVAAKAKAIEDMDKLRGENKAESEKAVADVVAKAAQAAETTAKEHTKCQDHATTQASASAEALAEATAKVNASAEALASAEAKVKASAEDMATAALESDAALAEANAVTKTTAAEAVATATEIRIKTDAATAAATKAATEETISAYNNGFAQGQAKAKANAEVEAEKIALAIKAEANAKVEAEKIALAKKAEEKAKFEAEKIALAQAVEQDRAKLEAASKIAKDKKDAAEMLIRVPFDYREEDCLEQLKKHVKNAATITNADSLHYRENWREYYNEISMNMISDGANLNHDEWELYKPGTSQFPDTLVHGGKVGPTNSELHTEIFDLMVKKGGNTRMIVRFNNANKYMEEHTELYSKHQPKNFDPNPTKGHKNWYNWRGYTLNDEGNKGTHMLFMDPNQDKVDPLTFERILTVASQEETFQSVKPFVLSALDGVPVGIFAYGATGSGKTYTMIGDTSIENPDDAGIIPRVVKEVAACNKVLEAYYEVVEISMSGRDLLTMKYLVFDIVEENSDVYFMPTDKDLLGTGVIQKCSMGKNNIDKYNFESKYCVKPGKIDLTISDKGTFKHVVIKNDETQFDQAEFNKTFQTIQKRRRTSNTPGNPNGSSRTHLITTIVCVVKDDTKDEPKECRISLVDLAGHEHDKGPGLNGSDDEKLSYGINQSLNALTDSIQQAQKKGDHKTDRWSRNIKLTGDVKANSQPLLALTSSIWSQKAGKVMMMACLHPMHQDCTKKFGFQPLMKDPGGSGNKNLGNEAIEEKLARDRSVLNKLSTIQKDLNQFL